MDCDKLNPGPAGASGIKEFKSEIPVELFNPESDFGLRSSFINPDPVNLHLVWKYGFWAGDLVKGVVSVPTATFTMIFSLSPRGGQEG
jgi:hypothetical protein